MEASVRPGMEAEGKVVKVGVRSSGGGWIPFQPAPKKAASHADDRAGGPLEVDAGDSESTDNRQTLNGLLAPAARPLGIPKVAASLPRPSGTSPLGACSSSAVGKRIKLPEPVSGEQGHDSRSLEHSKATEIAEQDCDHGESLVQAPAALLGGLLKRRRIALPWAAVPKVAGLETPNAAPLASTSSTSTPERATRKTGSIFPELPESMACQSRQAIVLGTIKRLEWLAAPPRLVSLAKATSSVTPRLSRLPPLPPVCEWSGMSSKDICVAFVQADKAKQSEMLQSLRVAQALVEMIHRPLLPTEDTSLNLVMPAVQAAVVPEATIQPTQLADASRLEGDRWGSEWSPAFLMTRNMGKKLYLRLMALHGDAQDVQFILRSAASNSPPALDVTHRVTFEDVAECRQSVMAMGPASSVADLNSFKEYVRYFSSKMRAGMVKLEGGRSLYILPPLEDVPSLRETWAQMLPELPAIRCLIGVVGKQPSAKSLRESKSGSTAEVQDNANSLPAPPQRSLTSEPQQDTTAEPSKEQQATVGHHDLRESGDAPHQAATAAAIDDTLATEEMSFQELQELFSNPDLLKRLNTGAST